MKRHLVRDLRRFFRSGTNLGYGIAVARKFGGIVPRTCNLCGYEGLFHAHGHPPRYDAKCVGCGARERQRLFGLLLQERPELGCGRVLHFAPEPEVQALLRARASDYRMADIAAAADHRLDVRRLDLPDASLDTVIAHHVLEHVDDDSRAMAELFRCLVPGGVALLSVPLAEGWDRAYEDPYIAADGTDADREAHFGRFDHVRIYGADFSERLEVAGFEVERFTASGAATAKHSLLPGDSIFIAVKPPGSMQR